MTESPFIVGKKYTKKNIYKILKVSKNKQGGMWDTGYNKFMGRWFIFCNVDSAGRTGHNYGNKFDGNNLIWYGKTSSRLKHPSIQDIINKDSEVYIFYRYDNRMPFFFAGKGVVKFLEDSVPVKVVWAFSENGDSEIKLYPEEISLAEKYFEGTTKKVAINAYERNQRARTICIEHYGALCQVCGFDFEKVYGEIGKGFIQVHHIIPLSGIGNTYEIDPIKDLIPVCPNCHTIIHRRNPLFTIQELKKLIYSNNPNLK